MGRSICLLLVLLLSTATSDARERPDIRLDGKAVPWECISLEGTPDEPRPGDLVKVDDVWIRLEDTGPLELRLVRKLWGRVLVTGKAARPVAVLIKQEGKVNPLTKLTAEEVRGLRGIYLKYWPGDGIEGVPAGCAVTLASWARLGKERAVPDLPASVECLVLTGGSSNDYAGFESLRKLPELRVLSIPMLSNPPNDVVASLTKLRVLRVALEEFRPGAVAGLSELRVLDLSWSDDLSDLAFVRKLPHLRTLELNGTAVTELYPLSGHASLRRLSIRATWVTSLAPLEGCPSLREVDATESEVVLLPLSKLPELRWIGAVAARVPEVMASAFRKLNPDCRLHACWMDPLREAVAGTDRLRLRTGGTCHREPGEKVLWETRDAKEIRGFLDGLELGTKREFGESTVHCQCCGGPSLEFYRGETLLAGVSLHHWTGLRWREWPGDAELTEKGAVFLQKWADARVAGITKDD